MTEVLDIITRRVDTLTETAGQHTGHRRLSEAILSLIEDGTLKPGARLPTETDCAQRLPFRLATIQKALRTLTELGVIYRRAGVGSIVVARTGEILNPWRFRFSDRDSGTVIPMYSRVTKLDRIKRGGNWRRFLPANDGYVRIEREINVDDRFNVISGFYLCNGTFGSLADRAPAAFEGVHIQAVIRREFGVATARTHNRVVSSVLPDPACLQLGLPAGALGLYCQMLGYTAQQEPLWFQELFIPPDADPLELHETRGVR